MKMCNLSRRSERGWTRVAEEMVPGQGLWQVVVVECTLTAPVPVPLPLPLPVTRHVLYTKLVNKVAHLYGGFWRPGRS